MPDARRMNRREARKEGLRLVSGMLDGITGRDVTRHLRNSTFEPGADETAMVLVEVSRIKSHLDWELAGRPKR
jgi:hypothetical protein